MSPSALHNSDLIGLRGWWACSEPERPFDPQCIYEENCADCLFAAAITIRTQGDKMMNANTYHYFPDRAEQHNVQFHIQMLSHIFKDSRLPPAIVNRALIVAGLL